MTVHVRVRGNGKDRDNNNVLQNDFLAGGGHRATEAEANGPRSGSVSSFRAFAPGLSFCLLTIFCWKGGALRVRVTISDLQLGRLR